MLEKNLSGLFCYPSSCVLLFLSTKGGGGGGSAVAGSKKRKKLPSIDGVVVVLFIQIHLTWRLKHRTFALISICAASNTPAHHVAGIAFGLAAVPIFVSLLHMISIGTFNWHDTDSVLAPLGLIVNNGVFAMLQHWSRKRANAYMETHHQTTSLHVPAESLSADLLFEDCPPLLFEEDNANNKHVVHVNVCIDNPRPKRRNLGSCPLPRQFRRANDEHAGEAAEPTRTDVSEHCSSLTVL